MFTTFTDSRNITKTGMPYLPTAVVADVERIYNQRADSRRAASIAYVPMALFQSPKPSLSDASLQSGRSGV
jgi:hypothetical protein